MHELVYACLLALVKGLNYKIDGIAIMNWLNEQLIKRILEQIYQIIKGFWDGLF